MSAVDIRSRPDCAALDARDPLAPQRANFVLPEGTIYLDGNSLGALPRVTARRVAELIEREWGAGLIRSWNDAGWIDAPRRVGGKIARLVGALPHEVVCADSTSINLFKVLACALRLQALRPQVSTEPRRWIVSERANFPTDLYMAQGLADLLGGHHALKLVDRPEDLLAAIDRHTAIVMLTHVNYRSGRMLDMAAITRRAHEVGALTVWDLAHSAGALPVTLNACGADFAVGCGYKYLNGGPGAPAFVFAAEKHQRAVQGDPFAQPLSGWLGHRAPFAFVPEYAPAEGIDRFTVGTPSILALAALECGVDGVLAAGIDTLRAKSVAQTELFIALAESRCAGLGLTLQSPRESTQRGSQVCLSHEHAWPVMQALIARGVIGDYRRGDYQQGNTGAPDILRFGLAPLYVSFTDVWDAVEALRDILATRAWDRPEFRQRKAVT
jgi:kynureninase